MFIEHFLLFYTYCFIMTLTSVISSSHSLMIATIIFKILDLLLNAFLPVQEKVYEAALTHEQYLASGSKLYLCCVVNWWVECLVRLVVVL